MKPKLNDLIRRKDVLAVLEEVFDQYRMSWGEQHGGFAAAVPTAIKNIPTAYDPDKVVEQLEEQSKNEIELWATEEINYDSKGDLIIRRTTDLHDYGMRCYEKAIEIVKGGVSNE